VSPLGRSFTALGSKRCYKDAWPIEKIIAIIKEEKGKQFDPKLVELFEENIDALVAIREKYPDSY